MVQQDNSNTVFQLAVDLVNDTSQHVFLTGKAGTGKTTFLKYIKEHTKKNTVIVAPTGVAAINAGGVTMHSFFQLPRGMFAPVPISREDFIGFTEVTDRHTLFKNIHFTSNKRELLQELELLIIDEVSMLRCDMLDAIDTVLRHFRKMPHMPFGGVQVVYIGDLFQLPPVVKGDEWNSMQQYYASPFFFSARVIQEAFPLYIELKKIYRQSDQDFIDVLNRIRNNSMTQGDYDFLNRKFDPEFSAPKTDRYITITTHNKRADAINLAELSKLPGKLYSFTASVKDDFSDKAYPTEYELSLKKGAQVMFIKNDSNSERRYFNGKLATVSSITREEITVSFDDGRDDLVLEKETWENLRYVYDKENDDIDEEVLGSFTQYPVRLAWAITVHKSQGLTFERAVIDAGASFAPGQVYVALSRCTSMNGLVLKSRITASAISTDKRVLEFAQKEIANTEQLDELLEREKYKHWSSALIKVFDWNKLTAALYKWTQQIPGKKLPDIQHTLQLAQALLVKAREQSGVAQKFQRQLEQLLSDARQTNETALLEERMRKAVSFFSTALMEEILRPLQDHMRSLQYSARISKYKEEVRELQGLVWAQMQKLQESRYGELTFGVPGTYDQFDPGDRAVKGKPATKEVKGSSQQITYELFKEGKKLNEIAAIRQMAVSTIEGHLTPLVSSGQLRAEELVAKDRIEAILKIIEDVGMQHAGSIKNRLDESYSFYEIRVVMNHCRHQKAQTA